MESGSLKTTHNIIDLGLGHPSLSLLPLHEMEKAMNRVLHRKNPEFLQYGRALGDDASRLILARFLSEVNEECITPEGLFITNGISQGLDLACTLFTGRHDTIFVEEPTYFYAHTIFSDHHLNVIGIPVDDQGITIEALEDMLRVYSPAFLYIIPPFQNPTSVSLAPDRREKLLTLSKKHDFYILSDEAYQLLHYSGPLILPLASMAESEKVISFGSFSKICAPGLRLGWIQAHPSVLRNFTHAGYVVSSGGLNPFTLGIITSFIEAGYQKEHLLYLREKYKKRAYALSSALQKYCKEKTTFTEPRGGFFIWVELESDCDAEELLERAEEKGVSFQPGVRFSHRGKLKNYVRLSFSYYDEEALTEGVRRLSEVL
ncbi:MAG: PLP-dependent aminotransferase family protein [Spirochaetales bacterium]|nr:PLP-dependent aminotransferase family protein [Spirochaetales bacterium]